MPRRSSGSTGCAARGWNAVSPFPELPPPTSSAWRTSPRWIRQPSDRPPVTRNSPAGALRDWRLARDGDEDGEPLEAGLLHGISDVVLVGVQGNLARSQPLKAVGH